MISFEIFSFLVVVLLVGLFVNQLSIRRHLVTLTTSTTTRFRSVKAQLIAERGRLTARPTLRNRELVKVGRAIDAELPVNEGVEVHGRPPID